jgi:metallophosphoesterase superfamily enzyme
MKILCIGDIHYRNASVMENDLLSKKIKEQIKKTSPDLVVFLGDLLHNHGTTYVQPFNQVTDLLYDVGQLCETMVIVGNHDYINNSQFLTSNHFLTPFKRFQGVTVVDTVIKRGDFIFAPYVPPDRLVEALNTVEDWKSAKAIFCHQDFYGVELNGIKMEHGDKWPETFPLVISGHIHEHQWLQKNICYVGTPYMTTFAETDEKAISLFEFAEKMTHTRIDVGMPKKLTVTLPVEQAKEFKVPTNTHVRLVVEGESSELTAFRKTQPYTKLIDKNVKVVLSPTNKQKETIQVTKKTYLELLKEMVGTDEELMTVFNEVLV